MLYVHQSANAHFWRRVRTLWLQRIKERSDQACPQSFALRLWSTRLHQLELLPITYWHEYLDMVLLYKLINNYTYIDESALPIIAESGKTRRETNENVP